MNRRDLFKFLASAPAAIVATPEPEPRKGITVQLPAAMAPGETMTIINHGSGAVAVLQ